MSQKCSVPNCTNPITSLLSCPKCIALGLPATFFCSQSCFKENYKEHASIHKMVKKIMEQRNIADSGTACKTTAEKSLKLSLPDWARDGQYRFTGDLRPCMQSPRRIVKAGIVKPDYAQHPNGVSFSEQSDRASNTSIRIYNETELEGIRHACRMGREVLDEGSKALRVGVTTDEIDRVVHEACMERDCYPSPLNYYNFPKSVCTSVNEVICHGIPDYREVEDGDIVNIDVTTYTGGYHGDLNETFLVGKKSDDDSKRLVRTAYNCLKSALDMVEPGILYRDLGTSIHKTAVKQNCSVVKTYCGHGIGKLFHTSPNIPHYHKNKAKGKMKVGHVFTVEPMINLGVSKDCTWDDRWTAVTIDGKRSAQFEHTVVVTENGLEVMTARDDLGGGERPVTVMPEWNEVTFQR